MNDDLKGRLAAFLLEWREAAPSEALADLPAEGALEILLDAIDSHSYAIVPKVPTEDQLEAGYLAEDNHQTVSSLYRAMLAAAPKVTK